MVFTNKKLLLFFALFGGIVVVFLIIMISSFFSQTTSEPTTSPTPRQATRFRTTTPSYSPLEKTEVGKTTTAQIEASNVVLDKKVQGDITIYTIKSASVGVTDELRAENEVIISERVNTFNKKSGAPPKITTYQSLGEPERIMDGVSPLGKHITAYLYPSRGVTIFYNRYTNTVYQIHTYVPMTIEKYLADYKEYIAPAPDYPKESFEGHSN